MSLSGGGLCDQKVGFVRAERGKAGRLKEAPETDASRTGGTRREGSRVRPWVMIKTADVRSSVH